MPITPEVLDQILKDYEKPEDLLSENGLLQQLTKTLVERALNGEMTHHLGYEKHSTAGNNSGNSRNGSTPKVLKGKRGQVEIEVPRDRNSEFEPQLVKKNQTRFDGLDEKIISLYARGMTTREIQGHLEEIDGGSAKPLPNVKVRIRGDDAKVIVVTTNEKGEFEVKKIKAGTYRVEPQLPNQYYIDEDSEAVEIADRGTAEVGFEAYFTGKAEGRIVDKNGAAFNSIFLQFLSVDAQRKPRQVTGHSEGENGEFSVEGVPPGEYVLFLELQHEDYNRNRKYYYPGTFKRPEAKVFKVGLGGKVKGLKFILPGEFHVRTVEGQVFWTDGKPAADVEIILLCPQSSRPNGFRVEFSPTSVRTDGEGKFKLEGFTGEEYWLEARGSKEGYKVGSLDGNEFYSPPKKIVLTENLKDIKVTLSENGFSGGCEN